MNLVIYGPQGSGKTTQARLLSLRLGLPHISSGGVSRDIAAQNTPDGKRVKALIEKGELVPDDILLLRIQGLLGEALEKRGFVLDGYPRNIEQFFALEKFLAAREKSLDTVVVIRLSDEEGIKRMISRAKVEGRSDDNMAAIKLRLATYHRETEPIIDYFRKKGLVVEVEGKGTIEEVQSLILAAVDR